MAVELVVARDAEEAARQAAELLAELARGGGHLVLSGGSTPGRAYELAAELEPDWSRVDVWLADERCVPADDPLANVGLVRDRLVSHTRDHPVLHPVDTALPPAQAAAAYDAELAGVEVGLALLGIGPDGHTASLYPDAPSLDVDDARVIAAPARLEPFVDRVTMTVPMLRSARIVAFLVVGADKGEAVRRAFAEQPSHATPASLVRSRRGRTVAILDAAAARRVR